MTGGSALAQGREAYGRCAWPEAYAYLSAVDDETPLESGDLELLATAAYLGGHDEASTGLWSRAHRAHLEEGEQAAAVRCAFWLGFGLLQRGEAAQGGGWIARARSLVEDADLVCAEAGYLLLPAGLAALGGGDHEKALELFDQVRTEGQRFNDLDLSALGRLGRGEALLKLGRIAEGLEQFDEAMVAVTTGELSPVVAGIVYCAVIEQCQLVFDMRRAGEWTAALGRWCDAQPGLVPYRGQCMVHRAQVMQRRGAWEEALAEAQRACEWLADPPHPAVGMAHYELGELYRVRGELGEAESAYRHANESGHLPQPGLALLRVAQGRTEAAAAAIGRAVEEAPDLPSRVRMLPACVEIMVAAGRMDDARTAADELANCAAWVDTPYVHAVAAHSRGAVLLAEGSPGEALGVLREAWRAWHELEAPYEAARSRVLIAKACRNLGDDDSATLECDAARHVFEELQAAPALAELEGISGPRAGEASGAGPGDPAGREVTQRELEVLRLVATGGTNRQIAAELVISEKTVERHLSNIFTKLDLPNRAAATAYAYDHGLV